LIKCAENGFTPYTQAVDDDIIANAMSQMQPQGRPPAHDREPAKSSFSLAPFYTLGGPTTHFAGNGADPWSEAGWGNKRAKLRGQGVSEEDWMLRTAEETKKVDGQLREYREERLQVLEGADAAVWVWAQEQRTEEGDKEAQINGNGSGNGIGGGEGEDAEGEAETPDGGMVYEEENGGDGALRPRQRMERKRSALSQEVTFKPEDEEMANGEGEGEAPEDDEADHDQHDQVQDDGFEKTEGGKIVVQTVEEEEAADARWNWGLGSWERGTVRAAYEVSEIPRLFLFPLACPKRGKRTCQISHRGSEEDEQVLIPVAATHAHAPCPTLDPTQVGLPGPSLAKPDPHEPVRRQTQELCPIHDHRSGREGSRECRICL
jgi:chromatin structure-remodeling complex protein RSC7